MPDAHARPLFPLAPGRHPWYSDVILGGPLAARARDFVPPHSNVPHAIQSPTSFKGSGARGPGIQKPRRCRSSQSDFRFQNFCFQHLPLWLHSADTCAAVGSPASESALLCAKHRPCSARARGGKPNFGLTRQLCDRFTPVVPALHSARKAFAPCLASTPSFRRPQTGETVKNTSCAAPVGRALRCAPS